MLLLCVANTRNKYLKFSSKDLLHFFTPAHCQMSRIGNAKSENMERLHNSQIVNLLWKLKHTVTITILQDQVQFTDNEVIYTFM